MKFVEVSVAHFQFSKMASYHDLYADSDSAESFEEDSESGLEISEEEEAVNPDVQRRRRLQQWVEMFGESDSEDEFSSFEADELELPRAAVRPQPLNFQTSYENAWLKEFNEATGLRFDCAGMTEVEVFLKLLGGEETVVRLVDETNHYARQYRQKVGLENLKQHSLANNTRI